MEPSELLLQRPPFLFVDTILDIQPGVSATAEWTLTGDEWFFAGHFPDRPILPGVLIVEAVGQTGCLAIHTDKRFAHALPLFGGLNKVRFRRQVMPGDTLHMVCDLERLSVRGAVARAMAAVEGELACEAELLIVITEK